MRSRCGRADGRIYFVTDRWGRPNLASMKPDGSDVKRLTTFEDYDVRWPAMGDGKIVYQHKMDIWIYDLATGKNEQVNIQLPSDRLQVREKFVDPKGTLGSWALAKDGERIALEARGDVFVARTKKKGLIRRITESSSARTKFPAFAPNGTNLVTWTEVDGEEQLLIAPRGCLGRAQATWQHTARLALRRVYSPDGKRLAWGDEKYRLYVTDAFTGETAEVDRGEWEITRYVWSPDSRYLAYDLTLPTLFNQVRIWDSQDKNRYDVSDPIYDSTSPAWDPKGKYLYFLSERYINPVLDRFEARFIVSPATLPCVVALQADGRLPFAPRSDTDPAKPDDKKKEEKKERIQKDEDKAKDKRRKRRSSRSRLISTGWQGALSRSQSRPGITPR